MDVSIHVSFTSLVERGNNKSMLRVLNKQSEIFCFYCALELMGCYKQAMEGGC